MTKPAEPRRPPLHPANHWGPFANDPWSPDLDPVVGEAWELAVRAGRTDAERAQHQASQAVANEVPETDTQPN